MNINTIQQNIRTEESTHIEFGFHSNFLEFSDSTCDI